MDLSAKAAKDQNLRKMALIAKMACARKGLAGKRVDCMMTIDTSGSMKNHYASGRVQEIVERLLALSMNLDDDGRIRIIAFGSTAVDCGYVTRENYHECVQYHGDYNVSINGKTIRLSGTQYFPALDMAYRIAFGDNWRNLNNSGSTGFLGFGKKAGKGRPKVSSPVDHAFFNVFITDGDCTDATDAKQIIALGSGLPMFTQFAGFGSDFRTLDEINNLEQHGYQREVDNAGVFTASTLGITDEQLNDGLLNELPNYLRLTASRNWYK